MVPRMDPLLVLVRSASFSLLSGAQFLSDASNLLLSAFTQEDSLLSLQASGEVQLPNKAPWPVFVNHLAVTPCILSLQRQLHASQLMF